MVVCPANTLSFNFTIAVESKLLGDKTTEPALSLGFGVETAIFYLLTDVFIQNHNRCYEYKDFFASKIYLYISVNQF